MTTNNELRTVKEIRIFLASPSDLEAERNLVADIVSDIDTAIARRKDASIRLFRWETDTYPYFHFEGPQGAIDDQVSIKDCDIFVCIFWLRFGSPTKKAGSGTEQEFWAAYDAWHKTGKPLIMLYRSNALPDDLKKIDPKQLARVGNFFNNTKFKNQKWVWEYKDVGEFERSIRLHLTGAIQDILDGKISKPETQATDDDDMLAKLRVPKEWKPITYNTLKKYDTDLPDADAIAFFNGLEPSWKEAVSPSIGRREIVDKVKNEIAKINPASPHIVLLRGLGGEGKSTILRQALFETIHSNPDLYILWHDDTNSPLTLEIIDELSRTEYDWIVASDDADVIEKDLRKVARRMREDDISNIRFLLTARDMDWMNVGADDFGWGKYANFIVIPVGDLTETDANLIVERWSAYGSDGLGLLNGKNQQSAVRDLLEKARTERKTQENSLLGAMLQVRIGKTMQEHYKPILTRLEDTKLPGNISLRKVMAYVAAFHAYNLKIVTPEILAHAIGFSEDDLFELVLKPLKGEIVVGKYVLIRHASIAEAIRDILKAHYDFGLISRKLLHSAHLLYQAKKLTGDINDWHKLPRTIFSDKNNRPLGIELAEEAVMSTLIDNTLYDPVSVTDLADLHEKSKQNNLVSKIFREYYPKTKVDRAYYYKWGVTEGRNRHRYLNIWLQGISLADGIFEQRRDPTRIYVSLSGLSVSYRFAYETTNDVKFLESCYSAASLGLENGPDDRARKNMLESLDFAMQNGVTIANSSRLNSVIDGIRLAWSQREKDLQNTENFGIFPGGVPPGDRLGFKWLNKQLSKKND